MCPVSICSDVVWWNLRLEVYNWATVITFRWKMLQEENINHNWCMEVIYTCCDFKITSSKKSIKHTTREENIWCPLKRIYEFNQNMTKLETWFIFPSGISFYQKWVQTTLLQYLWLIGWSSRVLSLLCDFQFDYDVAFRGHCVVRFCMYCRT